MTIDFFEKEVIKARERFNQTFGVLDVCDLKLRYLTILAISSLGLIAGRIKKAKNKDDVRDEKKQFMRTRTILDSVFKQFQKDQGERRDYANRPITAGEYQDGTGIIQGGSSGM
jgi:hypothetical protein